MICLYDEDGNVLRSLETAIEVDRSRVSYDNNGQVATIYALPGQYFENPNRPLPLPGSPPDEGGNTAALEEFIRVMEEAKSSGA